MRRPNRPGNSSRKPRRRRRLLFVLIAALVALALAGFATYRYLTRPERIRGLAQKRLAILLGRDVDVAEASFSLFGGLELGRTRFAPDPDDPAGATLAIESVTLRLDLPHLLAGRFEPKEITLREPVLTIHQDVDRLGRMKLPELPQTPEQEAVFVPSVQLDSGLVRVIYRKDGQIVDEVALPVEASVSPGEAGGFSGVIEALPEGDEPDDGLIARVAVSSEGALQEIEGSVPLKLVEFLLPPELRAAVAEYEPDGRVGVTLDQDAADAAIVCELQGLSARLPRQLGAFTFSEITGRLRVHSKQGIETLGPISLRVPRLGEQPLRLSGRYEGFSWDSPYAVEFALDRFRLPEPEGDGRLEKEIGHVWRLFYPDGEAGIQGRYFSRNGGEGRLKATLELLGASGRFHAFPYPLEGVRGIVHLTDERVESFDTRGHRGPTEVRVYGHADYRVGHPYDVTVEVTSCSFDEALRQAVPEPVQRLWPRLRPEGRADCIARVYRPSRIGDFHVDVSLMMDGGASVLLEEFPYPLEGIVGKIRFFDDRLEILQVTGGYGGMECMVDGVVSELDTDQPWLDLGVHVFDLPLDDTFFEALGEDGSRIQEALRPSGEAGEAFARVMQKGDGPIWYDVDAQLEGVRVRPREFPYELTDLSGRLHVRPNGFSLSNASARHGPGSVRFDIQGALQAGRAQVQTARFSADNVPLDADLRGALPEDAGAAWDRVSPSGSVDMEGRVSSPAPGGEALAEDGEYRVTIRPRGASLLLSDFPYPLNEVTGALIIVPGHVRLEGMRAARGDGEVLVDGEIPTGPSSAPLRLSLLAYGLSIDHDLISAAAQVAPAFARRLKPGGQLTASLHELLFHPPAQNATEGTGEPATHPASAPAHASSEPWKVRGFVAFRDARIDLGLPSNVFSGRVAGTALQAEEGLQLRLRADLDRVQAGQQSLTGLHGEIMKDAGNPRVQIRRIYARAHGGQADGEADLFLGEPLSYSTRLSLAGVDLNDLLNAGVEKPEDRTQTRGTLTAEIKLAGAGRPDQRRGTGILRITDAQIASREDAERLPLFELPVVRELVDVFEWLLPLTDSGFSYAEMAFRLVGRKLVFQEIYLRGAMTSFVGSGTVDLDTERLDVNFLGGLPGRLPRLRGVADQFLQAISREFFAVEVRGTLSEPNVEKILLPSLNIIRRIFRPAAEDRPADETAPPREGATTQKGVPAQ